MAKTVTTGQNYRTDVRSGATGSKTVEFVPQPSSDTPEEFERFTELTRKLAKVPKEELDQKRRDG
jgi:hypothetical protein